MSFKQTYSKGWCAAELALGPAVGDVYEDSLVAGAAAAALQSVMVSVTGETQYAIDTGRTCTCGGDLLNHSDFEADGTPSVSHGVWTAEYWCDACPGLSSRRETHRLTLKFRQASP